MSRLFDALQRAAQNGKTTPTDADTLTTADGSSVLSGVDNESPETPWDIDANAVSSHADAPPMHAARRESARDVSPIRALPAAAARRDTRDEIPIRDMIRVLSRRWKTIAAVVAATLALAVAYNLIATPLYEARARLLLDIASPQVMPLHQETPDTGRLDYFVTQLEVLRSRGLVRKTAEKLGLLKGDENQQTTYINELVRSLTITPVRSDMGESRVISVAFRSSDPEFAARLANGLSQAYVDQNLEMRRQGSQDASAWLTDRLSDLRQQVTSREGALQQYREQKDAVSLDDRQNIVVQKLAQLNQAVTTARTERVDKESLYNQLVAIQQSGAAVDTFPSIISNSFIQGLKADLATLQRERAQLAEHLGELHPDMIKVNTAIEGAERRLNAEMAKVIEGVKNDYKAAQSRERGLLSALDDQKREVLNLNQKSIGYTALQRDAASTQQIFESVLQRVKETDLSSQMQSNNARILDHAEIPGSAVWPRSQLNLLAALLGGTFLGIALVIGLEYMNPRISSATDVEEAFGLPMLGVAPTVAALKNGPLGYERMSPEFHEAVRGVRTRILLSPIAAASRSLAVTSATSGEGKTMLATSLATSMAMAGRRVLLIDADLRRPQVHNVFAVPRSPGLTNILAGEMKAPEALRESGVKGLSIVAAGDELPNMAELLDSEALTALTEGFGEQFDLIVMDCPPVMAVADASIIANATASVVFVVGAGTTRELAQEAIERLGSVQAQVVGVILNKAKITRRSAYDTYLYRQSA